jgi:hypothetical protein
VGRGARAGEKEGIVANAYLYGAKTRVGTIVLTFVPGSGSDRYKCEANTFVPVRATTWHECEAFVSGRLEEAPTCPYEGAFVPSSSSTRYRCYYL